MTKLIGSKEEEDRSYRNADAVMKATTSCMIVFSLLEVVIYYVYNYQVSDVNAFMRLPFAVELRKYVACMVYSCSYSRLFEVLTRNCFIVSSLETTNSKY